MATLAKPTEDEVRAKLAEIYARPEFSPDTGNSWLEALANFFMGVFDWLGELRLAAPLLFWFLLVAAALLLVLLVAYISWTVRRALFISTRAAADGRARAERARLSRTYLEESGRRAAREDYTEAIRCLFLALVYRFDETGRVSFQRAYTNREYLGLFEDDSGTGTTGLRDHLRVFVDILDDHWYGQQPADPRLYQRCLALYETIA